MSWYYNNNKIYLFILATKLIFFFFLKKENSISYVFVLVIQNLKSFFLHPWEVQLT